MKLAYSFLLTVGFVLMLPFFWLKRKKYAAGFNDRLGNYPPFVQDGQRIIWLHCVSVGEVQAARPLVDELIKTFPAHRIVVSTITDTGQKLAKEVFADRSAAVFYFPFDWKFSVRRALSAFRPSLVILMETEIWPRFIIEAKSAGAKVAIVNGRLSERSANRYAFFKAFIGKVLGNIDLAAMQGENDEKRIRSLGMPAERTHVTGNMKFDQPDTDNAELTEYFRERFSISPERPVIVAASTHEPEEKWVFEAFNEFFQEPSEIRPRLIIAPRHPERFSAVADIIPETLRSVRRSAPASAADAVADVILLDSIGELRAVYPLADIVFVGGSLIPHGGQSILEPAAAGRAVITGTHTENFNDAVRVFLENKALIQIPDGRPVNIVDDLFVEIADLLDEPDDRIELGENAAAVMNANRGATKRTIELLRRTVSQI